MTVNKLSKNNYVWKEKLNSFVNLCQQSTELSAILLGKYSDCVQLMNSKTNKGFKCRKALRTMATLILAKSAN